MKLLEKTLSHSAFRRAAPLLSLFSLLCTQVPLFNYLGFEFSFLVALVAGGACGFVTLSIARKHNVPLERWRRTAIPDNSASELELGSGATDTKGDASSASFAVLGETAVASAFLLAIPLIVMTGNALFVKNCSLAEGFVFFLLIPLPAVGLMNSVALLVAALPVRWKSLLLAGLYIVLLLHIPLVTFTDLQIFAYNPIVGFFPGITYDETLHSKSTLALYRISTVALSALVTLVAVELQEKKGGNGKRKARMALAFVCGIFVAAAFFFSDELGFSSSSDFVRSQLGGVVESEHFVITYPRDRFSPEEAKRLVQVHEFHFERLARELRLIPRKKIHSFLYRTPEQKQKLVGAGRTNIAKPWLWQIHLNVDDIEQSLAHEMVHVLAADFGFPILRVGWNPGLVEGLAVATERIEYDESIHRLARMAQEVGVRANLFNLFSISGFVRASPEVSYTLAGSFSRFLLDRYGWRRFKQLYRSGNFEAAYGKSLQHLVAEWDQFLSGYRLTEAHLRKGRYLFLRPSIFAKECSRVIAAMNARTAALLEREQFDAAFASASASLERSMSVEAIQHQAQALVRLKRYDEVVHHLENLLLDTTLTHALLPLRLINGDALLALGRIGEARQLYKSVFEAHLTLSFDEASSLRLEMLNDPAAGNLLPLLTITGRDSVRLQRLSDWVKLNPDNSIGHYLLGRQLQAMKLHEQAIIELNKAKGFTMQLLEHIRLRRIARSFFDLGRYQKAKMFFWQSLNYTANEAHAFQIQQWLSRCDWYERQPRDE